MDLEIVDYLVEKGIIKKEILENIISSGRYLENTPIEEYLIQSGLIEEERLLSLAEDFYGVPFASPYDLLKEELTLVNNISVQFMKNFKFIPVNLIDNKLTVIMANPHDFYTIEAIRVATNCEIQVLGGKEKEILDAIDRYYGSDSRLMDKIIEDIESAPEYRFEEEENVNHLRDLASEGPVIRLVNLIITRAIEMRASDIHFEPFEGIFRVRYRIDGVLHDVESPPKRLQVAIVSRIKIMAKLNIAERRLPQDGRIMLRVKGKEIDFRVSTIPTIYGESVVLRILDKSSILLDIDKLGFPEDTLIEFKELIQRLYGIILVTGPTGSGKTIRSFK